MQTYSPLTTADAIKNDHAHPPTHKQTVFILNNKHLNSILQKIIKSEMANKKLQRKNLQEKQLWKTEPNSKAEEASHPLLTQTLLKTILVCLPKKIELKNLPTKCKTFEINPDQNKLKSSPSPLCEILCCRG